MAATNGVEVGIHQAADDTRPGVSLALDPAASPFWLPAQSYAYTARPAAEVKAHVVANAGAGKL